VNDLGRNRIARLNVDGTLDSGFLNGEHGVEGGSNPYVRSVAVQNDGKVLIAADFDTVNGVMRNRIARLHADGSLDADFQNGLSGANGYVTFVGAQNDSKLLIVGRFTTVQGQSRNYVARLNREGTLDNGFQNGLPVGDSYVSSVALQSDGKVLIGGQFTTVNGVSPTLVARLNADGSVDSGFQSGLSGVNGYVRSVAVQSDGKVVIGGGFSNVNGVGRTMITRLNVDGTLDGSFQNGLPGVSGDVVSLALQPDGKVLIGGDFVSVNGVSRNRVARLNADGTLDNDFLNGLSGPNSNVLSVTVQSDGKIIIGGDFTIVNGVRRNRIARLNADGTLNNAFQNTELFPSTSSRVYSVAVQSDSKVLIGGDFTNVNNVARHRIARLNADGSLDADFQNGLSGINGSVYSIALETNGKVLIGGWFTTVNDVPAAFVARLWGSADIPPRIQSVNQSGADVNLIWDAIPNRTYRVQYDGRLPATNWTDLPGDISATSATASKTDRTVGGASQRFYRVMLLP
jgi:uncharacterized delta-60 repeat protein